jgi:hypothetical protein
VTWTPELAVYRNEPGQVVEIPAIDNIQLLRGEYAYATKALWRELERHRDVHGCANEECELVVTLRGAWCRLYDMSRAMDFVLHGMLPVDDFGRIDPGAGWVEEFVPGPWADPTWAHEQFLAWARTLGGKP